MNLRGCDRKIDATDNAGHTALVYAIKNRNSCAALTLIDKKADFKSRINDTVNFIAIAMDSGCRQDGDMYMLLPLLYTGKYSFP